MDSYRVDKDSVTSYSSSDASKDSLPSSSSACASLAYPEVAGLCRGIVPVYHYPIRGRIGRGMNDSGDRV